MDLLSTGVDVPCVRNIVFLQYVRSPIVFHQMLGRGTRLDPDSGKLMFRVFDYTEATALIGADLMTRFKACPKGEKPPPGPPPEPPVVVEGVEIRIEATGRWLTPSIDGRIRRVTLEEYREHVARQLVATAGSLHAFRALWVNPQDRQALLDALVNGGFSPRALQIAEQAEECDLYDVLGEIGYGLNRLRRADRAFAFTWKQRAWLDSLPLSGAETLRAIVAQFARGGTTALETPNIFNTPEVLRAGGLPALKSIGEPAALLLDTKHRLFAA